MYSKISVNIVSFFITIIIFSIFNYAYENLYNFTNETKENKENSVITENKNTKNINQEKIKNEESIEIQYNWGIYIPKIDLKAQISEGTTREVMDKFVGHFIDSAVVKGNVCLGAHNRGYPVNYFENIKNLQQGDFIYYKKDELIRKYIIETVTVIRDTDWTYLENTEDNRITLITCVENEPDYRRCIQALES